MFYKVSWKFRVSLPTSHSKASDLHHFLGMAKQHTFGRWNLADSQHVSRVQGVEKMLKDGEKAKFLVLVLQCKLKVLQKEHIDINIKKVLKVYKGCRHLKKKHPWKIWLEWKQVSKHRSLEVSNPHYRCNPEGYRQRMGISYQFRPFKIRGPQKPPKKTHSFT